MLFEAEAGRADFSRADLTEAMMGNIRLTGGKLDRANATEVDLGGALLNEASFTNATLNDANVVQARLLRANMRGVVADTRGEFTLTRSPVRTPRRSRSCELIRRRVRGAS